MHTTAEILVCRAYGFPLCMAKADLCRWSTAGAKLREFALGVGLLARVDSSAGCNTMSFRPCTRRAAARIRPQDARGAPLRVGAGMAGGTFEPDLGALACCDRARG